MIKEKLQALGFSDKEVRVYLALQEMGSGVASNIAKKAKINRSTAYVILESLLKRGLISVTERQGVRLYNAAPPEQLIQYLDGMAKQYASMASTAKELLPELKAARREQAPTPKVQMFEGNAGIKTVYEETLSSLEDIRVHANFESLAAQEANPRTKQRASEPDIKVETVFLDTPEARKRVAPNKEGLKKILLTSRGKEGITSEMNVYDDRVVFISTSEKFALIAESKEFASAIRKMCDAAERQQKAPQTKKAPAREPRTLPGSFAPAFG